MRYPASHRQRRSLGLTTTPMIDVVFLLLIFFICTASFQVAEEVLPTNLALQGNVTSSTQVELEWERIVVKLRVANDELRWLVNEQPFDSVAQTRSVLAQMAQIDATLPVTLDIDSAVAMFHVIDLYDVCRLVGFEKIQFAAELN